VFGPGRDPRHERRILAQEKVGGKAYGESWFARENRSDDDAELSEARALRDIYLAEQLLAAVPLGTYVMTYNGFGGTLCDGYELVRSNLELPGGLKLARKAARVRAIGGALQSSSMEPLFLGPATVALISRSPETSRGLESYLCDAGSSARRLASVRLEELLLLDTCAAVIFVEDFALPDLLPTLKTLHAQRPGLALVLIAGRIGRFALWRAFEGSALPPLVLAESALPAIIYDALRIACDTSVTEHMDRRLDPSVSLGILERPVAEVVKMLEMGGPLRDQGFDRLLPMRLRAASNRFWTPLDTIKRAATWFEEEGITSVVDIGSGVGKFCVAGALASSCSFIGIEQRPTLATVARNLARIFAVDDRVSIIDGRFGEIETPVADCYYLYNPFEENLFSAGEALDTEVELTAERFRNDLRCFRALVGSLPIGAYILSYNGIAARMPACLDELRLDRELPAVLRLLRKVRHYNPAEAPLAAPKLR